MLRFFQTKIKENKGFSLIELLAVIAIMVVLITMLLPNVVAYIKKAAWASEQGGAATVFSAAQAYATDIYSSGNWHDEVNISQKDLVDAELLTKTPQVEYSIVTETDTPVVSYISWESSNIPEGVDTPMYPEFVSED